MSERLLRLTSISAVLFLAGVAISACRTEPSVENTSNAVANNMAATETPKVEPPPRPVLEREALLIAAMRARSADSTGADDRLAQRQLDRQRFELRIRLGCNILAPGAPDNVEARYDAEARRVQLRASPDLTMESRPVAEIAGESVEAVEGFWIRDPWILSPSCAGGPGGAPEIGIAQFFTAEDPRTQRRDGRAYEIAVPLPEGATAPTAGSWDLVLRGRLRSWANNRVILCRPGQGVGRPTCIISVVFDDVSIEDVGTGRQIAHWGRG